MRLEMPGRGRGEALIPPFGNSKAMNLLEVEVKLPSGGAIDDLLKMSSVLGVNAL